MSYVEQTEHPCKAMVGLMLCRVLIRNLIQHDITLTRMMILELQWDIYLLWNLVSLWLSPWLQTETAVRKDEGNNITINKGNQIIKLNMD